MDNPRRFGPPHITPSGDLLGFVPGPSRSHDVAHRNPRTETDRTLDKDGIDPAVGRHGVSNLAGELHTNDDSLA